MTRNRLLVLIVVGLAVVGGAWFVAGRGGSTPGGAEPSPTVPPVAESTTVAADTRAVPIKHVELAAPGGGGVVAEVFVPEGGTVFAGRPLVRLDGKQLEAEVARSEAAVTAAEAAQGRAKDALDQAQVQVRIARTGVEQAQAGVDAADATRDGTPSGTSTRRAANAEVERARAALDGARAQVLSASHAADVASAAVDVAAADADGARAARSGAQAALDELTLLAPFTGVVASLDATVGESIAPGTTVARVADTSAWRFETIDLDEAAIGRLDVGANATITVDAFEDIEIPAKVTSIAPFGESSAGDIVYTVVLEPTGAVPEGLRWNMTASAQIDAAR
ncbi:MAG TPA: HlyD family efflux transporter periplasmic adaptor subunit [Candidatus Limnocylindrales bacterium]